MVSKKGKIVIPKRPTISIIATMARRERIKQYILKGGMSLEEIAIEEGIDICSLNKDLRIIKDNNILGPAKEATRLAFLEYSSDIEWTINEAKRLHEEKIDPEIGTGGRIDCLNFVATRRKEEVEMAQKLGLLDLAAEKQEHVHTIKVDDPGLLKEFGDFIATKKSNS